VQAHDLRNCRNAEFISEILVMCPWIKVTDVSYKGQILTVMRGSPMKRFRLLLASVISISLTAGCATPPISTATFSGTRAAQHQEKQGLRVQAEIVTDKARLKELFGVESIGDDILPLFVEVKNLREGKTFIVQPKSFRLSGNEISNTWREGKGTEGVTQSVVGSAITIGSIAVGPIILAPIAIPVILSGVSKQAHATVIQNNITRREFKSATLQKGALASGFLFFQLPKGQSSSGFTLSVNIPEAGTTISETYEFVLNR